MKELADLQHLQTLHLTGTKVTDAGLARLAGLKHLQLVFVSGTKVTDAGVASLKLALPRCEIRR